MTDIETNSLNCRERISQRLSIALALVVVVLLGATVTYMVANARHAVDETLCHSNLVKLRYALVEYESVHGSLPPASVPGPDGKAAHSWRVLILPHLDSWGIDGDAILDAYDMAEPWNAPANRRLFQPVVESRFACPCGPEENTTRTSYVVPVGDKTLFPPVGSVSASELPNTIDPILVLEITDSDIEWSEPRDLSIGELSASNSENSVVLTKPHSGVIRYITLSGRLGVLPEGTSMVEIKRLASVNDHAATAEEELP